MKRQKNVETFVFSHMGLFRPATDEIDAATARIHERLRASVVDAPEVQVKESAFAGRRGRLAWLALAAVLAPMVLVVWMRTSREIDVHAVVQSTGQRIDAGQILRTGATDDSITLADGSTVEMRSQSELAVERATDGIRVHLFRGGVIVSAAKQLGGRHLYVQTKDVVVSVVGTVFFVNAEEEGSKVAVIEGEVRVQQGATSKKLLRGEQLSTNPNMESLTVKEEVSWSPRAEAHVALLQQNTVEPAPAAKRLEFEVGVIRPTTYREIGMDLKCRGVDGVWSAKFRMSGIDSELVDARLVPQGRCVGIIALEDLIEIAYDLSLTRVTSSAIASRVANIDERTMASETYQLEGKAEDVRTATREQLRQMVRNLVIDRFKLRAHVETKEEDGYFLRAVESGVKFKETFEDEQHWLGTGLRLQPACYWCLKGRFSMQSLADALESFVMGEGKAVVNGTGLNDVYDITLMLYRVPPVRGAGGDGARGGSLNHNEFNPSLTKALEDQLGLRLERGRVRVKHVVVEHRERPTEN